MMRLTRFAYLAPTGVEEAVQLLRQHGDEAALMAGGTDLLVNIKHRVATPRVVVSLRRICSLQHIDRGPGGWLTLGAGLTLRRLELDAGIRRVYPALAHAAHLVSTPQVREVGTIGGNVCLDARCNYYNQSHEWRRAIGFCMKRDSDICRVAPGGDRCWAVTSADTVPVLIALGAQASVAGPDGVRRESLAALYQDDGLRPTTLQPGDILTAIHIPEPGGYACVYEKFRLRQSFDFPLVGVAVAVKRTGHIVTDARIVLTAVASLPERASAAEDLLRGERLEERTIEAAGQAVFKLAKPMDNTAGTIFHRKRMARVLTERALRTIAGLSDPARRSS